MEVVEDGGGRLSVVLAGHPKLRNDLRRPTMEEIGYRTDIFTLDGIAGSQREYIHWLLKTSTGKGKPEEILTSDAIDLLAAKLRTPCRYNSIWRWHWKVVTWRVKSRLLPRWLNPCCPGSLTIWNQP